jgi:protein-S-isoprenylcysteine O-methyltransferase Ste14
MTTSASASPVVSEQHRPISRGWGYALLQVATRRRMFLTAVIFTTLIGCDILLWKTRPCDVFNVFDAATVCGELLVLAGLFLRAWAAGTLHKEEKIIKSGPYELVRNPLYVGSFLMMLGFSVLMRDWLAIWIVLGPVLALYLNKVRQEERFLSRQFPAEWDAYSQRVGRFFPRTFAWPTGAGFSWKQWVYNREYQAALASLAGLAAMALWYRFVV